MSEPALVVEGARRRFARRGSDDVIDALDGVDLCVATGSITAVLGPSGCGKTTLLRAIAGTESLDAGRITIGGTVVADASGTAGRAVRVAPEHRRVGLVPQEGALFPHLDVAGNIAFGIRSLGRGERRARVRELLELVELPDHASRRTHELSGGEGQRVALARALAPRPDVVLLDEPFSALDATLRSGLRDEVAELLRRSGTTAVIVTHDRTEAMAIADEVAVMRYGQIVQRGRPDELYRFPVDAWTAGFLGDIVMLPGLITGDVVDCPLGRLSFDHTALPVDHLDGLDGAEVTVLLRPEQIVRLDPSRGNAGVIATVCAVQFLGPDVVVELVVTDALSVTARWPSSVREPTVSDEVRIHVIGPARILPTDLDEPTTEARRGAHP